MTEPPATAHRGGSKVKSSGNSAVRFLKAVWDCKCQEDS